MLNLSLHSYLLRKTHSFKQMKKISLCNYWRINWKLLWEFSIFNESSRFAIAIEIKFQFIQVRLLVQLSLSFRVYEHFKYLNKSEISFQGSLTTSFQPPSRMNIIFERESECELAFSRKLILLHVTSANARLIKFTMK